jgi:NB-ARC domain/Tetratricopeptide repeat
MERYDRARGMRLDNAQRHHAKVPSPDIPMVGRDSTTARPGMASLVPPEGLLQHPVRGRDAVINELLDLYSRRTRQSQRVQILHGMGGCGKTTVALSVARAIRAHGVAVWWVSAVTPADLHSGMRLLVKRLGATNYEVNRAWAGIESATDLLWQRLESYPGRWLLVVDGADDARELASAGESVAGQRGWVRPVASRRGAILVTSREAGEEVWGKWCRLRHVGMLQTEHGAQVLMDHAGEAVGTSPQAAALADRLGGLPLALRLVGAYLAETCRLPIPGSVTTFTDYREALDAGRIAEVLGYPGGIPNDSDARAIIDRTWELSLDLLDQRGIHTARPLLRLLSVFADAPVPFSLLLDPATLATSELFSDLNATKLRQGLDALRRVGLVELDAAPPEGGGVGSPAISTMLRLHPLVRDISRHHLTVSGHFHAHISIAARLLDEAASRGIVSRPDETSSWAEWAVLAPHVIHVFTEAVNTGLRDESLIRHAIQAASRGAEYLARSGLYATAKATFEPIVEACQQFFGGEHPDTLTARDRLAYWTGEAGEAARARDQYAALVPVRERVLGAEHPDSLLARSNLARWTGEAGDARVARDEFMALVRVCEQVLGREHRHTLAARTRLARWTGEAGDPAAARDQYENLLPVREQVFGSEHPDVLTDRTNLATFTGRAGDARGAHNQYAQLVPVCERVLGAEHPDTLLARSNLARWSGEAGDAVGARDQFAALIPVCERVLGTDHPITQIARSNLAYLTGGLGDTAGARDQYAALLPARERVFGAEHVYTLIVRSNLARWSGEAGDAPGARDQFAALVPVCERALGAQHPETLIVRDGLAHWTGEAGDAAEARDQYAALVSICEKALGANHPHTLAARTRLEVWTTESQK